MMTTIVNNRIIEGVGRRNETKTPCLHSHTATDGGGGAGGRETSQAQHVLEIELGDGKHETGDVQSRTATEEGGEDLGGAHENKGYITLLLQ